ncbi:hypothetical protein M3Y99_02004300 [Aphelenchoides fujianensis]|nr:hypothetical protein M3Y99_02004300 [Aphelenchoides fujianensis]
MNSRENGYKNVPEDPAPSTLPLAEKLLLRQLVDDLSEPGQPTMDSGPGSGRSGTLDDDAQDRQHSAVLGQRLHSRVDGPSCARREAEHLRLRDDLGRRRGRRSRTAMVPHESAA